MLYIIIVSINMQCECHLCNNVIFSQQNSSPGSTGKQQPETNGPTKRPRLNSDPESDGDQSDTELVVDEVCICVCMRV